MKLIQEEKKKRIQKGTVSLLHQLIEYIYTFDDCNVTSVLGQMEEDEVNKACSVNNPKAVEQLLRIKHIDVNVQLYIW